jgi:hypothetical protein
MSGLSMAMTKATNDLTYAKTKEKEAKAVLIESKAFLDNITKDDEDYPKFNCLHLKALMEFEKAKYNATEALIKLSFISVSNKKTFSVSSISFSSLTKDDDNKFSETCKSEIEKNVLLGKPVYTLLKALEFTQPALLAAKTIKISRA